MWNLFFKSGNEKNPEDSAKNEVGSRTNTHKSFSKQNPQEMEVTLKEGAKLFSRDFTRTIELLANE